ncbi:hypothetical protein BCV70DRAFT_197125 [Testicularia cyperi]|uniref:Uncharacterized protein n=1 Tax=Testicularia cyperi TaxID=1882483 RepID=A0A317XX57_9BASI|nr:hypothetical protein BCV70DRAFT_197125 [Testicularia cyperi]
MSQSTPTATPLRRQRAVDTPGSARSTLSASTSTDRATLVDRIDDLELSIRDLKRQINAERERRSTASQRQLEKRRAISGSDSASSLSSFGLTEAEVRERVLEKLREMDDDALSALLTASTQNLARFIIGSDTSSLLTINPMLIPSKSVGIEGVGSGSDIDRRLRSAFALPSKRERDRMQQEGGDPRAVQKAAHARSINEWLLDRQKRTEALVRSLSQFTYLEIESLTQTDKSVGRRGGGREGNELTESATRTVRIKANMARLFPLEIGFDITDDASLGSPQITRLSVDLPTWLESALNEGSNHLARLIRRNDLPAVLLTLRTLIPMISLRRTLFTTLMQQYTDLARTSVLSWEEEHKTQFQPWSPDSRQRPSAKKVDDVVARSLIVPSASETFILQNSRKASLSIVFRISFNRFGHAVPNITLQPSIPRNLRTPTIDALLDTFEQEFQHLLATSLGPPGIIHLPDLDDDSPNPLVGKFGLLPPISAVIHAFFGIPTDTSSLEEEESDEQSQD